MNNYKKVYEFLVWDNCNNNCSFCFQRKNPRIFNKSQRKIILDEVINFLNGDKFIKGSHVLICGGEIFDKISDFNMLNSFFEKIIDFMKQDIIDLLYINTNLIYKDLNGVYNLLNLIKDKNLFDRLKFTTSYDLKGRFKSKEDELLMLNNLKTIKSIYPECNIVTNIILTKQTCESILNKSFVLSDFIKNYNCKVNLIPYIVYDKDLSASRSMIFSTLKYVNKDVPGYLAEYIPNISIEQEKLLYMYKDDQFVFCSCKLSDCSHSINFKRYSENNTCFCCDLKEVFEGLY